MGRSIRQTFDYDGGRIVTAHLPSARPDALICCADGQMFNQFSRDLEASAASIALVCADRTDAKDEMVRLAEYSLGFDDARFAAHERFFVNDIQAWLDAELGIVLPPRQVAVAGASASAEFALAMALRHPARFGVAFAASPGGGFKPPSRLPQNLPRTYLTAGTLEPFFLANATRWAEAMRMAGADAVLTTPIGDHGDPFWQTEFVKMAHWAFGS